MTVHDHIFHGRKKSSNNLIFPQTYNQFVFYFQTLFLINLYSFLHTSHNISYLLFVLLPILTSFSVACYCCILFLLLSLHSHILILHLFSLSPSISNPLTIRIKNDNTILLSLINHTGYSQISLLNFLLTFIHLYLLNYYILHFLFSYLSSAFLCISYQQPC